MSTLKPKLEFFRLKLNPIDDNSSKKTFKDFVRESLDVGNSPLTDNEAFIHLFNHFIKSLSGDLAKDDKIKKKLQLVEKKVNKYLANKPIFIADKYIIHGVINGGQYGRDRILGNNNNPDETSAIEEDKTVLQYYYFFLYLPLDHSEGCLIIHSNSIEESVTNIFRHFIANIFKTRDYHSLLVEVYCPKSFQKEFRESAVIKNLSFKTTFIESENTAGNISDFLDKYDIYIKATPKKKGIRTEFAPAILKALQSKMFGSLNKEKKLNEFGEVKLITENIVDKSIKTFEWNTKDHEFAPVIYLENRITKYNSDKTPDFNELEKLCKTYFFDEIKPELRPDLYETTKM